MRIAVAFLALVSVLSQAGLAQAPTLVERVREALGRQDFAAAEQILTSTRPGGGLTPEWLEAYSWLGRGARTAKQYDRAERYAQQTHTWVLEALKTRTLEQEPRLATALGAAIEVQGHVLAETGARSEGVAFLQRELTTYRNSPIGKRVQKDLNLLSLEGTVAPPLDLSEGLGTKTLSFADVKGKVAIVFFWAHWCPDCKRQSPVLAALLEKYRDRGLAIVAPTQYYGYVTAGKDAPPAEEKRQIISVRNTYYRFLSDEAVTISEANHLRYGVSSTPTLVLLDREGIVRAYHPGNMTAAELEPLIQRYLQ